MKKILILMAVVAMGFVSCKKDNDVQPLKDTTTIMGAGSDRVNIGMD